MQWTDDAILLSHRPHGENALLVSFLSRDHGRYAGLVAHGQAKRHRATWQIGSLLGVRWQARLSEQLGSASGETRTSYAARWLDDADRLAGVSAACAVTDLSLPEREPHSNSFAALLALFDGMAEVFWPSLYVHWELGLLGALGFGLDLTCCAVTGSTDALIYVSPKSGRAVSQASGEAYHDRLLPLPAFLTGGTTTDRAAIVAGLTVTGYFFERHVWAPHGRNLPAARSRLVDRLRA